MKVFRLQYIALIAMLSICEIMTAQNLKQVSFIVKYKTSANTDTTVVVTDMNENSFEFFGGKGTVAYSAVGDMTPSVLEGEEENKDIYACVENVDYKTVTVFTYSKQTEVVGEMGFCVSKTPNAEIASSESMKFINDKSEIYTCSDILNKYKKGYYVDVDKYDLTKCNTFRIVGILSERWNDETAAISIGLTGLGYHETYYVRPYVIFGNGAVMYGGEKSFTTLKTKEGAVACEENLKDWSVMVKDDYVFSSKALNDFCTLHSEQIGELTDLEKRYISDDLNRFVAEDGDAAKFLANNVAAKIDCVDGVLKIVDKIPDLYWDRLTGAFDYSPIGYIEYAKDLSDRDLYTKYVDSTRVVECKETDNVPYNSYMVVEPSSAVVNPSVAIIVPKVLLPGAYTINITFAPDLENNDEKPFRVKLNVFEKSSEGEYPNIGVAIRNTEENSVNFDVEAAGKQCGTLSFDYDVKSLNECMIQLTTSVSSKLLDSYTRVLRIAKVEVVPKR